MQDSLNSSIGYYSDGLVRALVTFCAIPVAVAYLSFGLVGTVGAAFAHWICYRSAIRIGLSWLGDSESTGPRPKHWLLGFGFAIAFQAAIVLFCFTYADQEIVSERLERVLSPVPEGDRRSSGTIDPGDVLDAARADRRAGRHEEALEKLVWYHENAREHSPSRIGVGLTFALYDWLELARVYPPALEKLKEIHAATREAARNSRDGSDAFSDFHAINRALDAEYMTVELFKWLDVNNPSTAESAYIYAEDALVAAGEYAVCGKYIRGLQRYRRNEEMYRFDLSLSEDNSIGNEAPGRARMKFSYQIALLVALLVKDDRSVEAADIADRALRDWEGHLDKQQIAQARKGVIPTKH